MTLVLVPSQTGRSYVAFCDLAWKNHSIGASLPPYFTGQSSYGASAQIWGGVEEGIVIDPRLSKGRVSKNVQPFKNHTHTPFSVVMWAYKGHISQTPLILRYDIWPASGQWYVKRNVMSGKWESWPNQKMNPFAPQPRVLFPEVQVWWLEDQQFGPWHELEDWSHKLSCWGRTTGGAWISFDHGAATLDHLTQERNKLLSYVLCCWLGLTILTDTTHLSQGLVGRHEIPKKEPTMLPGANSVVTLSNEFWSQIFFFFFNYHSGSTP